MKCDPLDNICTLFYAKGKDNFPLIVRDLSCTQKGARVLCNGDRYNLFYIVNYISLYSK